MDYGQRIRDARKNAGLTQEQLAKKCGVATITIRQYESNKREPRMTQLEEIAKALDISVTYLLGLNAAPMMTSSYELAKKMANSYELAKKVTSTDELIRQHLELEKESDAFIKIYKDYLNDHGKREVHRYTELLIKDTKYLKKGIQPLTEEKKKEL